MWYYVYAGTCICVSIGSTLIVVGVLYYTLRTCEVFPTTLVTGGVNRYTLVNIRPFCGRWVSGGCTAYLEIYDGFFMGDIACSSNLNCDTGVGFYRTCIICCAAIADASTEEVFGFLK